MPRVSNNPKSFLKTLSKNWKIALKTAKENGLSGPPDDGKYQVRILEVVLDNGTYGWQMIWRMQIVNGDSVRKKVTRYDGLEGERSLEFVAANLLIFGIELEDIEDLQEICEQITEAKPYCQITVQTKEKDGKERTNIYLNKHIADDDVDDETASDEEASSDENEDEDEEAADPSEDEEDSDEEEADDDDEGEDVQIGMRVEYEWKGQTCTGEIVDINEETEKIIIKDDEEGKKRSVSVEKVVKLDEEEATDDEDEDEDDEEEEEETPAPKRGRPAGSTNKPKASTPTPATSGKKTPPPSTGKTRNAAPADDGKKKFGKLGKK